MRPAEPRRPDRPQAASSKQRNPQIEDAEKEDPHNVDEVPVERDRGDTDVMLRRELSSCRAIKDDRQQHEPAEDVRAVEARHDEESAREGVRGERHPATECGDELIQLAELESEAEDDRRDPQHEKAAAVAMRKTVGGKVAGDAGGEQHDRVDRRNGPPVDVELGRARGRRRRPLDVRAVQVEVAREEASEEHHLGCEEDVHPHHPGLDRRVLGSGLLVERRYSHQWCTSPPSADSAGYICTSSTRTQPTTPIRKINPPTTARVMRTSFANGIAARLRNNAPAQMTNGHRLGGGMWIPSSRALASKSTTFSTCCGISMSKREAVARAASESRHTLNAADAT